MASHQVPHDDWVDLVALNGGGTFHLQNQGATAIYPVSYTHLTLPTKA